ncbi:MAG TPA: VOC family protein [Allosphingosinicella sp.]
MDLNQVTLVAHDYERSVAFYRLLGLRLIVDAPPRYARFECGNGATFSIHVEPGRPPASGIVYFETEDLDARAAALEAAGLAFLSAPRDQSWLWREARLLDPAGNEICLYHAGPNRRFPPWRVEGS